MNAMTTATDMVRTLTDRELNAVGRRIREGDDLSPEYSYAVSAESRRRRTERPLSGATNGELFENPSETALAELGRRTATWGNDPWWC